MGCEMWGGRCGVTCDTPMREVELLLHLRREEREEREEREV
jgi:hypothetical protein